MDIQPTSVVRARGGAVPVAVGDGFVLLDGWDSATCLNATGALIWSSLDGRATLAEVAGDLAASSGADQRGVLADVVAFVTDLGRRGLLEGVEPPAPDHDVVLEAVAPVQVGDLVADPGLCDLHGAPTPLLDGVTEVLVVNWNPHCGYCARIAHRLADLEAALAATDRRLVLVATGSASANQALISAAGYHGPVLLHEADHDLFAGAGTPAAYHLDAVGTIVSPPAYGADEVLALLAEVAGVDLASTVAAGEGARYLLERDGLCGPTPPAESGLMWEGSGVYRVGGFHVGIRYDTPATAVTLDRLLPGHRVEDPWAGHSYSVALDLPPADAGPGAAGLGGGGGGRRGRRGLNLLAQAGRPALRSRDASRVLRALLADLSDATGAFDPSTGRIQVDAIAVVHRHGAALLPWGLHVLGPRLQPLLAGLGLRPVDHRYPQVDLATGELVVPEPAVDHDPRVLDDVATEVRSRAELPAVPPGRYPLISWCVTTPGDVGATPLSPAQAAAATLSLVRHTDDAPERVRQLGRLFSGVRAYSLWYHSEATVLHGLGQVLADPGPPAG